MGYWKSNILFSLLMLGMIGYLIKVQHPAVEFVVSPMIGMMSEYSILLATTGLFLYTLTGVICMVGSIVYLLRWWILGAILILWIASSTSKRRN